MTPQEIKNEVNKINGWFSSNEMDCLYPYVKALPEGSTLVELGTYKGRSTLFFRLSNPKIKITTIDECVKFWEDNIPVEHIDPFVLDLGNINYIIENTHHAVKHFSGEISFLFIDSLHTFEGVQQDIKEWANFVQKGGYIVLHDYYTNEVSHGLKDGAQSILGALGDWEEITLSVPVGLFRRK